MSKSLARVALSVLLAAVAPLASARLLAEDQKARDPGIAEGVRLFDAGRYDDAVARYREVLARNPDDAEALYELAYTYEAKKDWTAALETAKRGAAFESRLRPALYVVIGNVYDEMGQGADAIAAYRSGINANPAIPLLHFNLGVAYLRREEWREARRALQQAALLRPDHASTHYSLAYAYEHEHLKPPAFLAYVRFLLLEPDTARSRKAFDAIDGLFRAGYSKDAATGNVTLTVSEKQPREDEGDFTAEELGMLAAQAGHEAIDQPPGGKPAAGEGKADAPKRPHAVERVFESLSIAAEGKREDPKGFAETYYLPYFRGLQKQELLETAAYLACRSADVPEVGAWLKAQAPKVEALRAWSASFKWSGPRREP